MSEPTTDALKNLLKKTDEVLAKCRRDSREIGELNFRSLAIDRLTASIDFWTSVHKNDRSEIISLIADWCGVCTVEEKDVGNAR